MAKATLRDQPERSHETILRRLSETVTHEDQQLAEVNRKLDRLLTLLDTQAVSTAILVGDEVRKAFDQLRRGGKRAA